MFTIVSSGLYEKPISKLTFKKFSVHLDGEIDDTLGMFLKNLVQRFRKIISSGPVRISQYEFPKDLKVLAQVLF